MVHLFKHLSFICPFTYPSGYNSDTITELERKCRRLQTQVFQMEVQWNTVLLPRPRVYTTTSLLRRYSFKNYCRGCQPACEENVLSRLASPGINGELAHRLVVETSVKQKNKIK